jgi:hypothetical protein
VSHAAAEPPLLSRPPARPVAALLWTGLEPAPQRVVGATTGLGRDHSRDARGARQRSFRRLLQIEPALTTRRASPGSG